MDEGQAESRHAARGGWGVDRKIESRGGGNKKDMKMDCRMDREG